MATAPPAPSASTSAPSVNERQQARERIVHTAQLLLGAVAAATGATVSTSATAQEVMHALTQGPAPITAPAQRAPSTPMGRMIEVALRTGTLTIAAPQATATTAASADLTTTTTTTPTPALSTRTPAESEALARTFFITDLVSSSASSHAVLSGLSPVQRALVQSVVDDRDPSGAAMLVNTIREAVRAGKDEEGIAAAVQTNLNGLVSFRVLLTLPEVTSGLSARSQQIVEGIGALGNNTNVSWLSRQLTPLLTSKEFGQASPTERDQQLATLVAARSSYAGVSSGFEGVAEHLAQAVDDGSCTVAKGDVFRVTASDVRPAGCTHTITFSAPQMSDDGSSVMTTVGAIRVVTPPGVSARHASVQDIGEALSHLPAPVRALVKTVVLNPVDNPEDAYWRAQPGFSPTLRAFMTAGADGTITIYPSTPASTSDLRRIAALAGTFTHEAAHVLQPLVDADPALKALWDRAAASDDVRASSYAFSSRGEDFAESFALYSTSRLSPELHAAMRNLMPQRFAAFDAIVAALPRLQAAARS